MYRNRWWTWPAQKLLARFLNFNRDMLPIETCFYSQLCGIDFNLFTLIWFTCLFYSVRDRFCTETVGELDLPENCSHDSWISTNSVFPLSSFSSVSGKVLNSLRKWVHGSLEQCGKSQSEVTLDFNVLVFCYFWFRKEVVFVKLCTKCMADLRFLKTSATLYANM